MVNPFAPPDEARPQPPPAEAERATLEGPPLEEHLIKGPAKSAWRMGLYPDRVAFTPPEQAARVFTPAQLIAEANFVIGIGPPAISFKQPERIVLIFDTPGANDALKRFLAPVKHELLASHLRARFKAALPIGALVMLLGLPIDKTGYSPALFVFGLGLFTIGALARKKPDVRLYLLNAAIWAVLVSSYALTSVRTGSFWFIGLSAFGTIIALGSVRAWRWFR